MRQRFEKMLYLSGSILFQILLIGLVINLAGCVAGIKPVAVKSGSMEPAVKTGSICWVNFKADKSKLGTGDIVAFERGDGQLVRCFDQRYDRIYFQILCELHTEQHIRKQQYIRQQRLR